MDTPSPPMFVEVQRFRQRWLWCLLGGEAVLLSAVSIDIIAHWLGSHPAGDRPSATVDILNAALALAIGWGAVVLLAVARLVTEVRHDGLYIRFAPFHRSFRRIPLETALDVRVVQYRPIAHYGGWGLRRVPRGRCYNVSGNRGLRVDLPDRRHILIGSQRPEELLAALASGKLIPQPRSNGGAAGLRPAASGP